ncbi:MAG: hypothetical protein ABI398_05805 [Devosia sp.]
MLLTSVGVSATPGNAATVSVEQGNVLVDGVAVTTDHSVADPILTPDGKFVVFTHYGKISPKMADCAFAGQDTRQVSLWIADLDGKHPRKLLDGRGDTKSEHQLCDFGRKAFNAAGTLLYFETPAWVTSDAIHVLDMASGKEHFVIDGSGLVLLSECTDPRYLDNFVVVQHRYFVFGGSYDWAYLVRPDGKVVGPLGEAGSFGETLDSSAADEACGVQK